MATQHARHLLQHDTEAGCDPGSEISGKPRHQQPFKYSVSSSCSSGQLRLRGLRRVPQLFERSAAQCWDPAFDSAILEEACRELCFPQIRRHFRYALSYLAAAALLWGTYFGASGYCDPTIYLVPAAAFLVLCLLLFLFTFTRPYARLYAQASLLLIAVSFALTLALQAQTRSFPGLRGVDLDQNLSHSSSGRRTSCVSPVATFSLCVEVLLLLYSILHVRLYASLLLGLLYSMLFEALGWLGPAEGGTTTVDMLYWLVPARALLHLCAHALGVHLFITSEVRSRSTFLKVGEAIMDGKDLEVEKVLKERMIHSVMPRRVADELLKQGDEEAEASGTVSSSASPKGNKRKKTSIPRGQIIFRPFNMKRMEPVSILFADIVGFTRMSANKTAPALVGLLNDLFGRFDHLCELTCCEKISTLGDCYYCVAGCPEPRPDHAYCCVEMGLGMIQAIGQFCRETRETVSMRVGVHTGTVLCGILGMKRFKFDVWSNDVNLANLMEQLGVAGKVHLSEVTAGFLDDRYWREDGCVLERHGQSVMVDQLKGLKTYLISGRKTDCFQHGGSQFALDDRDTGDSLGCSLHIPGDLGLDPTTQIPNLAPSPLEDLSLGIHEKAKPVCVGGDLEEQSLEGGTLQNGCQEERKTHADKVSLGQSPRTLNGLLSPPREEATGSSRSSLCDLPLDKGKAGGPMEHSTLIQLHTKSNHQKSDTHFVEAVKEDGLMKEYFFKPPINKLNLNFLEPSLESAYRSSYQKEVETQACVCTFASPTFSSFLDVLLSCVVLLALEMACFLRPLLSGEAPPTAALAFAAPALLLGGLALLLSIRMAFCLDSVSTRTRALLAVLSGWVPRHLAGAVLVSLPAVSVFTHVVCNSQVPIQFTVFLCCGLTVAIVHHCNCCQLSFWMRSCLATAMGGVLLVLLHSPLCRTQISSGTSMGSEAGWGPRTGAQDLLALEAVLALLLLLLLVWFLNRELEVRYRLHYHGNVEADQHRIKIQNMRDQANWLLGNIIPMHVAEQLKVTQSYSKNHDDVAVIFASIVNFSEFYEESYEGGKECYRVLNELIGDFDELLRRPAFSHVEKIKTIGATYMAAAGLNARQRREQARPRAHLRALFDFALEMMRVVDDFNKNMLGFKFKLRIGFNHGPLTAGVIGTTKLLYDIWGDTVNIGSRMDSTGVECRVQVSEGSHAVLSRMGYDFEYRGTVNVKGKGQMRTFLFPSSTGGGSVPGLFTPGSDPTLIQGLPPTGRGVACSQNPLPVPSPSAARPAAGPVSLSDKPKGSNGLLGAPRTSGNGPVGGLLDTPHAAWVSTASEPKSASSTSTHKEEDEEEEAADELSRLKPAKHV
ncbi:adenylate cyclase type 9-like [Brienomyrus brachyistius]|uniref:adenylate cyclase type 9-like n=1 Tax=Brienomyrus brachyistius TaxID=42636 RepID=UPI0020B3FA10|nr:adenylate cyclase type 9-like [Brienomyrus brachyistius]